MFTLCLLSQAGCSPALHRTHDLLSKSGASVAHPILQVAQRVNEIVEVEKLFFVPEEAILYLRKSQASDWAPMPVEEIIRRLEVELAKAKNAKPTDVILLERLFAPTGAIQEISIDNGGGTKFLRISEVVDQFTGGGN